MNQNMTIKELYERVRDGNIISDITLQREIIYNNDKQRLVIDSIVKGIPLPAFYLWKNDNGILEVLDGKQRIEAIKRYKENDLEYNGLLWRQTSADLQEIINNYELSIIVCEGTEQLKREIFRRINTLGVPLSAYEVLNGLYNGEYLRGLTTYVSNDRDAIKVLGSNARGNNQIKILKMLKQLKGFTDIDSYVKENKDNSFAADQRQITRYIKFIGDIFEKYSDLDIKFRLAVDYIRDVGIWKEHRIEINREIAKFLKSDAAKLLNKETEYRNIILAIVEGISVDPKRLFTEDDKLELLRQETPQDGKYKCKQCRRYFYPDELTVDHIEPWSRGGRTELSNAQLLCRPCNSAKGNR